MSAKNEVVEMPNQMSVVTKQDVESLQSQRGLLRNFVSSQLTEANFDKQGEGDFGIIPGTKKRSLFKQGAEKLQRLFQLGCSFEMVDKIIDKEANFAMYTYKARVYSLRDPSKIIAECEASVNSQETKYKERTVWKKLANGRSESTKEPTPIYDVLNTIQKMAQKRAMIGATILATGASEYFTQDMLDEPGDGADVPLQAQPPRDSDQQAATAPAGEPPFHTCGKKMMLSKYPNKETGAIDWYCLACKKSVPQGGV